MFLKTIWSYFVSLLCKQTTQVFVVECKQSLCYRINMFMGQRGPGARPCFIFSPISDVGWTVKRQLKDFITTEPSLQMFASVHVQDPGADLDPQFNQIYFFDCAVYSFPLNPVCLHKKPQKRQNKNTIVWTYLQIHLYINILKMKYLKWSSVVTIISLSATCLIVWSSCSKKQNCSPIGNMLKIIFIKK